MPEAMTLPTKEDEEEILQEIERDGDDLIQLLEKEDSEEDLEITLKTLEVLMEKVCEAHKAARDRLYKIRGGER